MATSTAPWPAWPPPRGRDFPLGWITESPLERRARLERRHRRGWARFRSRVNAVVWSIWLAATLVSSHAVALYPLLLTLPWGVARLVYAPRAFARRPGPDRHRFPRRPRCAPAQGLSQPCHRVGACPGHVRSIGAAPAGWSTPKWSGRCPSCGAWNALTEEVQPGPARSPSPSRAPIPGGPAAPGALFAAAGLDDWARPGASGPRCRSATSTWPRPRPARPGWPSSTASSAAAWCPVPSRWSAGSPGWASPRLLLQVLAAVGRRGRRVLLVSAEESAQQVRLRAERLGPLPPTLRLLDSTDVATLAAAVGDERPALVVVDSIQAISDGSVGGMPGSLAQVRACADLLVRLAKALRIPFVLVGHVTKDGALAGPRVLEHLVDTVVTVEGDRHHALRLVRAVKHRFGPTGELGLFEMGEAGLAAVADPYRLLLGDRRPGAPGSAILPAIEGQRALLVEVQALASPTPGATPPRRSAQGVDGGRLGLLLAVLENRAQVVVRNTDVFCSAVGGIRVGEPAADLAVALAVASAVEGVALPPNLVAFGEVGLTGEIRQVPHAPRRLAEAARVGFRHAVVPDSCPAGPPGMELVHVRTLAQAIELASGAVPPAP